MILVLSVQLITKCVQLVDEDELIYMIKWGDGLLQVMTMDRGIASRGLFQLPYYELQTFV